MDKKFNHEAVINRAYVLGKFLPYQIKDVVLKRISELSKENPELWGTYRRGMTIGMEAWALDRKKRLNNIKSRGEDFGRGR